MIRLNFSNWDDRLYVTALLIATFILIFFYRHLTLGLLIIGLVWLCKLLTGKACFDGSWFTIGLILLVLMVTVSWVLISGRFYGLSKLLMFLLPAAYYFIISSIPVPERQIQWFPIYFSALIVGKCCYQLIFYRLPHTEAHRLIYFGNPIVYGQMVSMACVLCLFIIREESSIAKISFYMVALLIGLTGLFFTYARGAWLGFAAAAIWFTGVNLKHRLMLMLAGVLTFFGIGVFIVEPAVLGRIASIFSITAVTNVQRLVIWKTAVKIFTTSPLSGIGFHMFAQYFQKFNHNSLIPFANHAHNNLLHILTEFGLLGLGIWLLAAVALINRLYKNLHTATDPFRLFLTRVAIAWLISLLVHGLTDYTLAMSAPMVLFMMMLGLLAAVEKQPASLPASSLVIPNGDGFVDWPGPESERRIERK